MDKTCWFVVIFRLCRVGKLVLEVVVSVRACAWSLDLLRWGLDRLFVLTVFTAPGRWLRYRRCYGWQRMTPARRAFRECRMQFP